MSEEKPPVTGALPVDAKEPFASQPTGRRRSPARRNAAGTIAGIVLLSAVAVLAAGALNGPRDSAARALPIPTVDVPAGDYVGVCPAAPTLSAGEAESTDPDFSPVSTSAATTITAAVLSNLTGSIPGSSLSELGGEKTLKVIAPFDGVDHAPPSSPPGNNTDGLTKFGAAIVQSAISSGQAAVLRVEPRDGRESVAKAIMAYTADDGDLRGLAAANCHSPGTDFWLLGASTTAGSSSVLRLVNPSQTPVTVNVDLHGQGGPVRSAGSRGLLVRPGESREVVLAGLAAQQEDLAVRIRSTGGAVGATIQQSVLRGLTPGGVELIQRAAPASNTQVVGGIRLQDHGDTAKIMSQKGYGDGAGPALQVAVPGGVDAALNIRLLGPNGPVDIAGGAAVSVKAGTVAEVLLGSLPEGTYTAEVTSTVSIVASVRVNSGAQPGKPVELAWAPSSARLGTAHLAVFAGAAEVERYLAFGATEGQAELRLTAITPDGKLLTEKVVTIAGGTTVPLSAKDIGGKADVGAVLISAAGGPVYGAQVLRSTDFPGISVVPVPETNAGQQSQEISLGY